MGLTSALYIGMSGLNSNQFRLDVIGDNIANVNTTAFKSSRAQFQTQFARSFSYGTSPGASNGGTNPFQIGLGSLVAGTTRQWGQGGLELNGVPSDLAIEGAGLFVLRKGTNDQVYTRDGAFGLNAENYLVSQDGYYVQGYGVDENFNLVPTLLADIQIPLGTLTIAQATANASFDGNLNADGTVATTGNTVLSNALVTDDAGTVPAGAGDLLINIRNNGSTPPAPTVPIFAEGDVLTLSGATRGGRDVPDATFTVQATSTLQDLMDFLAESLGIQTGVGPGAAGITVDAGGQIQIISNAGEDCAVNIPIGALSSTNADYQLAFEELTAADGESAHTSFLVFDSLGTAVRIEVTMVMESVDSNQTTWRFYVHSPDDTDGYSVSTGTATFDAQGRLVSSTGTGITIDRDGTGATTPLAFTLDLSDVTQLSDPVSTLVMTTQDGFPPGTLNGFSVGGDGTITGTFSNGLSRTMGQVVLATFSNYEGLVELADNLYSTGANSGQPIITAPLELGAGRISAGMLEMSNVDLSREFIGLITTSTGFSAAGRVINTSDKLLQELLTLAR